jgi:hypothetical protein
MEWGENKIVLMILKRYILNRTQHNKRFLKANLNH